MKKIVLVAVLAFAASVQAEFLYWQVGNSVGTDVSGTYSDYDTAAVYAYLTTPGDKSSASPLSFSYNNMNLTSVETPMETMGAIDLSQLGGNASDYTFYIELSNYDSGAKQGTSESFSYAQLSDSITSSLTDIAKVQAFNGGNAYHVAPEPTSGMLLMVGFALLSLKRRKV